MLESLVPTILDKYQVEYTRIFPPQTGYRNISYPIKWSNQAMANLILYKAEPEILVRIQQTNTVSNFLADLGLPTRHTLDPRIICLQANQFVKYGSLYNYLPGQTIAWEAYTKDHLKLTGMMMSHMHASLKTLTPVQNKVADEYHTILKRMQQYFAKAPVQNALVRKLNLELDIATLKNFERLLRFAGKLPGQQTLHMDFVRGNLLFAPAQTANPYHVGKVAMSGILDFEKAAYGHPLFDIARTLAFLLVDCRHKSETKIRKYFLISGYNKRGSTQFKNIIIKDGTKNINLLEALVDLFLVYDLYKFLRHNPYEFLEQNHHFLRTRDILIKRNMVKYSN